MHVHIEIAKSQTIILNCVVKHYNGYYEIYVIMQDIIIREQNNRKIKVNGVIIQG